MRYETGRYSKYGKYVGSMKYVHYNRVPNAINHLLKQGLKFNFINVFHRKTGKKVDEFYI